MYLNTGVQLQEVLSAAHTSLDAKGVTSFQDVWINTPDIQKPPLYGDFDWTTNGVAEVLICPAPQPGYERIIKTILLNNLDTGAITIAFQRYTSAAVPVLISNYWKWTLATLNQVQYCDGLGWQMFSSAGVRQ